MMIFLLLLFFSSVCVMVAPGWILRIIKKVKLTTSRGLSKRRKKSGASSRDAAPQKGAERRLPDRKRQSAIYGQGPAPFARHSLTAPLPWVLEFWLPGKISVLGERGLSFACSHPSRATRKKEGPPLSTSPVCEEHLHWWSDPLSACALVSWKKQASKQHLFLYTSGAPSCFFFFFSSLTSFLPSSHSTRSPEGFGCGCFRDVGTLRAASPTNTNNCHRFFSE